MKSLLSSSFTVCQVFFPPPSSVLRVMSENRLALSSLRHAQLLAVLSMDLLQINK